MRSDIFFRPEEAMLETGKSLSTESKLVLFTKLVPSKCMRMHIVSEMGDAHVHTICLQSLTYLGTPQVSMRYIGRFGFPFCDFNQRECSSYKSGN